jgi:DNA-binding NtrC family response regulator
MEAGKPKVLLIGGGPQYWSCSAMYLRRCGCDCQFAFSYQETRWLVGAQGFDLVLSLLRLQDGSAFPLIRLLEGSSATLFFCLSVEDGCWWLPALRCGLNSFGSSALRPRDFVAALEEAIEQIRLRLKRRKRRTAVSSVTAQSRRSRVTAGAGAAQKKTVILSTF